MKNHRKDYSSEGHYNNGEKIIENRIEYEEWYPDFQAVCEIVCKGFSEDIPFEIYDNAIELCLKSVKEYFVEFPGPSDWQFPDDERLKRWISSCMIDPEGWEKINRLRMIEKCC